MSLIKDPVSNKGDSRISEGWMNVMATFVRCFDPFAEHSNQFTRGMCRVVHGHWGFVLLGETKNSIEE